MTINEVGAFDLTGDDLPDGFEAAISTALRSYNNLTEAEKKQVTNYDILAAANARWADVKVAELIDLIDTKLANVTYRSEADINEARDRYNALSAEDKARVTNYDMLTAAESKFLNLTPIQLNSYTLKKDSIGDPEFYLNATNVSGKVIKEFSIQVFFYDADGLPVPVYFGHYTRGLSYSRALRDGERTKSNVYWQLYGTYNEMKQAVVIVNDIEYFDGTTWENPRFGALYAKYNEKILAADDPNILSKG